MKATVLVENSALPGLAREHGLSVYLEHRGRRILLDAGHSGRFADNADALGIDLAGVDTAVLSHGHYDHGNGLDTFFSRNSRAQVCARPAAAQPQFFESEYIGLKPALLSGWDHRFRWQDGPSDLGDGIFLIPDKVPHEQSLVLDTRAGLVVLNSCSHAGAGFIARDILRRFPGKKIAAYLGGFHLMGREGPDSLGLAPDLVTNLAGWLLDELEVGIIYTGHCTGRPAFQLLQAAGGDRVRPMPAGTVIELG